MNRKEEITINLKDFKDSMCLTITFPQMKMLLTRFLMNCFKVKVEVARDLKVFFKMNLQITIKFLCNQIFRQMIIL